MYEYFLRLETNAHEQHNITTLQSAVNCFRTGLAPGLGIWIRYTCEIRYIRIPDSGDWNHSYANSGTTECPVQEQLTVSSVRNWINSEKPQQKIRIIIGILRNLQKTFRDSRIHWTKPTWSNCTAIQKIRYNIPYGEQKPDKKNHICP